MYLQIKCEVSEKHSNTDVIAKGGFQCDNRAPKRSEAVTAHEGQEMGGGSSPWIRHNKEEEAEIC